MDQILHTRRKGKEDPLTDARILQRTINRLRRAPLSARGVFRFSTHDEADQWMIRQMAAHHARRSSKI